MRKRILSTLLVLCMVLGMLPGTAWAAEEAPEEWSARSADDGASVWDGTIADSYAGGSGTSNAPYLIATAEQLARVANQINSGAESGKSYRLTNDIYLNDISDVNMWDAAAPQNKWTPIGSVTTQFSGTFDGAGYTVFGLYLSNTDNYQGLFGHVGKSSPISNLSVKKSYIKGGDFVGGVCGYSSSSFNNCHNEATVVGNKYISGIVGGGGNPGGLFGGSPVNVESCSNTGKITGQSYVGGVLGNADTGVLKKCYNVGAVTGSDRVGGIAGRSVESHYCWNIGDITGTDNIGGVLGEGAFFGMDSPQLLSCFNAGHVSGETNVGGLLGFASQYSGLYPSTVSNCYNVGQLTGSGDYIGGISGKGNVCKYTNCYNAGSCSFVDGKNGGAIFNEARQGSGNLYFLEGCCGTNYWNGWSVVSAKSSAEMQDSSFVSTMNKGGSAWIEDTNKYNLGYPILSGIDYAIYKQYVNTEDTKGPIIFSDAIYSVDIDREIFIMATIPNSSDYQASDVTWTVNDENIATIVSTSVLISNTTTAIARVRGIANGRTIITINTTDGRTASCSIKSGADNLALFDRFVTYMPKLTDDQATKFLKFIHGVSNETELADFSDEDFHHLLTGNMEKYSGYQSDEALTMLKSDIVLFSTIARSRVAALLDKSAESCESAVNTMTSLLISTLPKDLDPTLGVPSEYTGKLNKYIKDGLVEYGVSTVAKFSTIFISETVMENLGYAFDTFNDIISSAEKLDTYLKYVSASIEGTHFIGNENLVKMYSYFNQYITKRPLFDSNNDQTFKEMMNLFADYEDVGSSGFDSTIFAKWIGVKSFRSHIDQLEAWGEYLCNLEEYASTLYSFNDEVEVLDRNTIYGGMAYSISVTTPSFTTVRYGNTADDYQFMTPPTFTDAGKHTTYYCITAPHYEVIRGSATVNIEKATRSVVITSGDIKLSPNESTKIEYKVDKDVDGSSKDAITFSSSNPSIATIDNTGKVVAHSPGISYITVNLGETKNYYPATSQTIAINVESEVQPTHTHSWTTAWSGNATHHWHECSASNCPITGNNQKDSYGIHDYDNNADTTCNTCGYTRVVTPPTPAHTHNWATTWCNDTSYHWYNCAVSGCPITNNSQKSGYGAHVYSNNTDTTCNICGYTRVVTPPTPSHSHDWAVAWSNDETYHWHECNAADCTVTGNSGKNGYATHTWDAGVVTVQPTADKTGVKTYTCTVCKKTYTETIPVTQEDVYTITGQVAQTDIGVPNVKVKLMLGTKTIASQTTGRDGIFSFSGIPAGTYNLRIEKDGIVETRKYNIRDNTNLNISLPDGKTNSEVEIKGENTPEVVVGGLDKIFEDSSLYTSEDRSVVTDGGMVDFKLTVEKADKPVEASQIEEILEEQEVADLYLNLVLTKTVVQRTGATTSEMISEVQRLIETIIPLPAEMQKKVGYTVYRVHNGIAEALPEGAGSEYYTVSNDKTSISIFASKYSVYAIAWSDKAVTPPTPEHTHDWATAWSSNTTHHWHECTASDCDVTANSDKDGYGVHDYDNDADATCNTCGYIRNVTPPTPEHTHAWAEAWSSNTTYHWHECTASDCDVTANSDKDGYGVHDYDNDADATCNTCGYTRVVTPPTPEHTHVWAMAWSSDTTHHWHECTASSCTITADSDKSGYGAHDYDSDTDATCNTCGYTRTVTPPTPPRPVDREETYYISIPKTANGEIIPRTRYAEEGERVTLTAHPDSGYELDSISVTNIRGREITLRDLGDNRFSFTMPNSRVSVEARFKKVMDNNTPATSIEDEPFTGLGTPGISGIVLNPVTMPFADVNANNWYYNSVDYVWKHYLMSGVSDTQFAPNTTTSRAMIWTILARMNNVRTDINPGSVWYEKGMLWAMEQGVTDGSNAMGDITREQLATMLWRNAGSPSIAADLGRFSDSNSVSDYALPAVRWAVANGILQGANGELNPKGTATRAQVAAMVMRYGERIGA